MVGFDDSLPAQVIWPGLTSVRQPLEEVAVELVRILHLVLAHKPFGDKGRMLRPSLVVRRLQPAFLTVSNWLPGDHFV